MSRVHILSTVAALLAATACSHAQLRQSPVSQTDVSNPNAGPRITQTEKNDSTPASEVDQSGRDQLDKALSELRNVRVFFSFDSSLLTHEGEQKLADVGRVLAGHPTLAIRIEGNCDERGTEDYNLALGQSRAEEARRYLATMGVQSKQLTTVSYGDERPVAQGHDEAAWHQNRRDDVVVAN